MTDSKATRMAKSGLAALTAVALVGGASAATITWGGIFSMDSASDVDNSGSPVAADAFGDTIGTPTVNGVAFDNTGGFFDANLWATPTGDGGLDDILDSHNHTTGAGPYVLSLTGLTGGQLYQIQVITVHDLRTCCGARQQTLDDGMGNFTGPTFQRNIGGSAIGTFVADGSGNQDIQLLGNDGTADPGLSGYIVRAIPEPGSLALLGLGGLALLRRRR